VSEQSKYTEQNEMFKFIYKCFSQPYTLLRLMGIFIHVTETLTITYHSAQHNKNKVSEK